eukprot:TRINITY_DN471_c0_g1_i2.p1 TRINITY_DN471_c0_g1~~TRINITY_DN471_c0_g1_i2.p1  ORF type:complete len:409 (-),score=95.00 TRINITY_DN471_c0_g1_i2:109-1335(-)
MNTSNPEKVSLSFHCTLCSQVTEAACCLIECGHTFCVKCLREKLNVTQREGDVVVVKCSTCHMSTCCLDNAEQELREPVVETLVEILGKDNVPKNKELCGSGPECGREAQHWCPTCENPLCDQCFEQHGKTGFTKKHHNLVTRLDQKKKEGRCLLRDHRGHQFSDILKNVEHKKVEFGTFIDEVKGELEKTQTKRSELKKEIEKLQSLLKQETKRETLLKITFSKLKLAQTDLPLDQVQLGTFGQLEKQLRKKLLMSESLNQEEKVEYIVNEEMESKFFEACEKGDKGQVIELLQNKINPNLKQNFSGSTGLCYACGYGHKVSVLMEHKADLNLQNNLGSTPLILACLTGHKEIAEGLIQKKANPKIRDKNGYDALYWAKEGSDASRFHSQERRSQYQAIVELLQTLG